MNDRNALLLPPGLYDLLPPDASKESGAVAQLLGCFTSFGYAQVSPPLMEFEASLFSERGDSLAAQTFRIMDPLSGEMMGLRSDMTLQVGRVARSRFVRTPRPLRLCYAGHILQINPEPLRNERQLMQAGIELIGSPSLEADAEVIIVAAEALAALGMQGISVDINLSGLLSRLCPEAQDAPELQQAIREAVTHRESASIRKLPLAQASLIAELIETAGTAEKSLATLERCIPSEVPSLRQLISRVRESCPHTGITLDPLESRGFDYHQGISFSLFAQGLRHELGRGGRYEVGGETATGFTLYVTHLLDLLPPPPPSKTILLPLRTSAEQSRALRAEGWVTVGAMTENPESEAKQLSIPALWQNGRIVTL